MNVARRTLLGALAIPFLPTVALGQRLGGGPAAFSAILNQIGGITDLSPVLIDAAAHELKLAYGEQAHGAFVEALGSGLFSERLTQANESVQEQVRFIAKLLYTGEISRNGRVEATYYPWCLAWRAISFATAPGLCAGPAFGHWADAPSGVTL